MATNHGEEEVGIVKIFHVNAFLNDQVRFSGLRD
jgi:hypothetical protein